MNLACVGTTLVVGCTICGGANPRGIPRREAALEALREAVPLPAVLDGLSVLPVQEQEGGG